MELNVLINGVKPEINLFPTNVVEEVMQNIRILCSTIIGTVPLDRKLGINSEFIDAPILRAQMKARIFMIETIQEYEPRAEVISIHFQESSAGSAHQGNTNVNVKVRLLDEYIT